MSNERALKWLVFAGVGLGVCGLLYRPATNRVELPNRIPEAAPYVTSEAQFFPPPFEEYWQKVGHPGQCQSCHQRIFDEWNGSMMSNAWRDPAWRGAFLLSARQTSTDGDCSVPTPPDGTPKARHNPFAREGDCSTSFDIGDGHHVLARPGSLMDGFCSRCHMPSNYVDNVPLHAVSTDSPSGREHAALDPNFNPVSDNGTGIAFATLDEQHRNTETGKRGVFCAICHSIAETRDTPYHNYRRSALAAHPEYVPALGMQPRTSLLPETAQDMLEPPDQRRANLGYAIGAGSFRLSPHAIGLPERTGPLTSADHEGSPDRYLSGVFKADLSYLRADSSKHHGFYHALTTRAEMCSACHDVTNPLTIKNRLGKWVGGFPIERTYAEWGSSRYADRPGNRNFDPAFKRDCQTCHMQQDYDQPGTAQTLYDHGAPLPPLRHQVAIDAPARPYFTHHFVGGNSYITRMIGADVDEMGNVQPYPELSIFSFSSADKHSLYSNAFWRGVNQRGPLAQQARLAWDRLRNVLDLEVSGPETAPAGAPAPLYIRVTNSGSGHKFPTGFPEGRIAWLAVHAFDLATGKELALQDTAWHRTSVGIGNLTAKDMVDPNFPGCRWRLPAGSVDPYAYQLKAVASLGDGCPTLDLVYAHALNLVTNAKGQPVDERGVVIDRESPTSLPQFRDVDGDGDFYDDSYLRDTRLPPLPVAGATLVLDRYSVVVPARTVGPVAVTASVYYQSVESMVAKKFLGNLADTDTDFQLETCVLHGACDGRVPSTEPAVVEGAPPVPMEVRTWVIRVAGSGTGSPPERAAPRVSTYPASGALRVVHDVVVKATFSMPVRGVDAETFTLTDGRGNRVAAAVDQIGDGTWALFPSVVFLEGEQVYTARLAPGICGVDGSNLLRESSTSEDVVERSPEGRPRNNCTRQEVAWSFRTAGKRGEGSGDTRVALGFPAQEPAAPEAPPAVASVGTRAKEVFVAFSKPVMNVTPTTLSVWRSRGSGDCSRISPAVPGRVRPNSAGDLWTFVPAVPLDGNATYCVTVSDAVYDLRGQTLPHRFTSAVR